MRNDNIGWNDLQMSFKIIERGHRRRLHGGDAGDRPHGQKVVGAMAFSRRHRNFIMSPLYTAKRSANLRMFHYKSEKVRWYKPENAPKAFVGRALPRPAGGAYSARRLINWI